MLPICFTFDSFVLKLLLHVHMATCVYMAGEGLWNLEIYVSHVNWCIANNEAVRIVLLSEVSGLAHCINGI